MRITDIKINNYRAFYGEHHIALDKRGKNLMLYGENGSGKSSLFTAMKDFFLASTQKLNVLEENIFIAPSKKHTASIKITLRESAESSQSIDFELNAIQREIISSDKALIVNANKIKGFLDYRNLLKTHITHEQQVDLFNIIVNEILYHSINRFSGKEIGKEWENIYNDTFNKKQTTRQQEATKNYIKEKFNPGLSELLASIEKDTNTFIQYFGINITIKLAFDKVEYVRNKESDLKGHNIHLKIDFHSKYIPKHQHFLNEARLTALAISLYLASIKVNPTKGALKILVLDDLLIGLDMSNRLPLLDILKKHFVEVKPDDQFQIIMTTYDKVWYELVKSYFGEEDWKFVEVYSQKLLDNDFEIPIIRNNITYLDKAKKYLAEKDFKASAVYIRTEFERLVKNICDKQRIHVVYRKNAKEVTSDDFWNGIESQSNIDAALVKEIAIHRGVVMNPFSHYDLEKPEFEKELKDTIMAIEKLTAAMGTIKKIHTWDNFKNEIVKLTDEVAAKNKTISELGAKLKSE